MLPEKQNSKIKFFVIIKSQYGKSTTTNRLVNLNFSVLRNGKNIIVVCPSQKFHKRIFAGTISKKKTKTSTQVGFKINFSDKQKKHLGTSVVHLMKKLLFIVYKKKIQLFRKRFCYLILTKNLIIIRAKNSSTKNCQLYPVFIQNKFWFSQAKKFANGWKLWLFFFRLGRILLKKYPIAMKFFYYRAYFAFSTCMLET